VTPDDDLRTQRGIRIAPTVMQWGFARSGGAGGQNVNKTSTKASLTVDVADMECSNAARARIIAALGETVTVTNQTTRSQWQNRRNCLEQLAEILDKVTAPPPAKRKKTKPTRGSVERRLDSKRRDSEKKRDRRSLE
jgi:ribosome-associated protein